MSPIISTRELANAIGVSESSLKRWADDGTIRVSRTAGGHRRIAIGEAIRFIRSTRAPLVRPEALGLRDLPTCGDPVLSTESPEDRLYAHLKNGKAREARGLVLALYLGGNAIAEIADGPIRHAMDRLGLLWQHEKTGVFEEHRATDICIQAVQQLRQLVEPDASGPVAIGGGAPGDPYLLPPMLATTALSADGWQAVNLGPDTPFDALHAAVEWHEPRLVWLSVSSIRDKGELEHGITRLAARLADREVALVLGGRALDTLALPPISPPRCGATISDLVAFANEVRSSRMAGIDVEAKRQGEQTHATA